MPAKRHKKYLSVMIIPHHKTGGMTLTFSYRTLRLLLLLALFFIGLTVFLIFTYGQVYLKAAKYEIITRRNAKLEIEFEKLSKVKSDLAQMRQIEEKVKNMLQAEKTPPFLDLSQINVSVKDTEKIKPPSHITEMITDWSEEEKRQRSIPKIMPTNGWISREFSSEHKGIDIAATSGTPIFTPADGQVTFAGWDSLYGHYLIIDHGYGFTTHFGHCSALLVKVGAPVRRGEIIAFVGSSGKSTGPHLHYQVYLNDLPVDPRQYIIDK
ncbi:MAG: M23 family metallopeptidase [Candidatus Edwardsbacteria bacterium]